MKTKQIKPAEVVRAWHVVDAKDKILGKVCVEVATLLMGKHKVSFTPHVDSGDFVVVINAKEVAVSGNKAQDKKYFRHSMYPGGAREISFEKQMAKDPKEIIIHGVKGMVAKNKMRDPRMARLKVFEDATHPYTAQLAQVK